MKKTFILILVMGLLLAACSAPAAADIASEANVEAEAVQAPVVEEESEPILEAEAEIDPVVVDDQGNTDIDAEALDSALTTLPAGELTALEVDGLAFMREEEKLARDVYLTLYEKWNMPVFQNIAGSESTHMDAVLTLLERYSLDDPSAEKAVGEFTNPDLQALYDQLVNLGSQSLADALKVGAAIEEIDILGSGRADGTDRTGRYHHGVPEPAERLPQPPALVHPHPAAADRRGVCPAVHEPGRLLSHHQFRDRNRRTQAAVVAMVAMVVLAAVTAAARVERAAGGGKLFELSCNQNKILKCRSQDYRLLFCVKLGRGIGIVPVILAPHCVVANRPAKFAGRCVAISRMALQQYSKPSFCELEIPVTCPTESGVAILRSQRHFLEAL